jgi:glycogen operon protein
MTQPSFDAVPRPGLPRRRTPVALGVSDIIPGIADVHHAVNVAVHAPGLDAVDLWYTGPSGELRTLALSADGAGTHYGVVTGLRHGASYAFWKHAAPWPRTGQLLLDPYARAIEVDDAGAYWGVHVGTGFDWGQDTRPRTGWRDTVIYEAHVKGQTMLHPGIPEELRGTYAGMAHPVMIEHLTSLGVTAVELLPIHFHVDEPHLQALGLPNYWGYNTLGFFAPHTSYATRAAQAAGAKAVQDEVKGMIRRLHAAGIEVILDVVLNHTAEGGKDQQSLSWRGLGDAEYYRHDDSGNYLDTTGCGNTLDFNSPAVRDMALACLRMWAREYHVDGFRFDLAVSLARDGSNAYTPDHPFLAALDADPVLKDVKLIAEPWDVAPGGWQTGNFPRRFADWNDSFRDTVRDFWVAGRGALEAGGQGSSVARLAGALAGSREVFAASGRGPLSSINFVTAHDGFTLRDLVSYNRKHNSLNGEDNRDGNDHNRSYNHGIEGASVDDRIRAARLQTASNVMATLLISLGVPMITAGDEMGKTQHGNNNAYCQDSETTWLDWTLDANQQAMLDATRALSRIRREFLADQPTAYPTVEESSYLLWFNAEGKPMRQEQWTDPSTRLMQLLIGSPEGGLDGMVVFNGALGAQRIRMPEESSLLDFRPKDKASSTFQLRFSTSAWGRRRKGAVLKAGEFERVEGSSITVYRS